MNDLIYAEEAAKMLHISPGHLVQRKRLERGFPAAFRPGHRWMWSKSEIEAYIASTRQKRRAA